MNIKVFWEGGALSAAFAEGFNSSIGANLAPVKTPPLQPTEEFSRIKAHAVLFYPLPLYPQFTQVYLA